ncbi:hypothetical protein KNU02_gp31 [Gordonia phage Pleakley]|uniref:Uncharacterized protein n=1 Tax=Gordonia phage Pleakley TaxID=2283246 RepID=A0A345M6E9_9CAUD|nr:hypothetical protein KNU02_gp31 [Gordonia phage Pleakley]AXH49757.1 hypothetical protein SEA_FURY_31 [Gordonia phage Fury]AXH66070.1 hypothetical protein SEA_PLEAKLEY_31 [Gordonia phage Pleakley]
MAQSDEVEVPADEVVEEKQPRQIALFMDASEQRLYVRDVGNGVEMYHEIADLEIIASYTSLPPGSYCVSAVEDPRDFAVPEDVEEPPKRDPLAGLS